MRTTAQVENAIPCLARTCVEQLRREMVPRSIPRSRANASHKLGTNCRLDLSRRRSLRPVLLSEGCPMEKQESAYAAGAAINVVRPQLFLNARETPRESTWALNGARAAVGTTVHQFPPNRATDAERLIDVQMLLSGRGTVVAFSAAPGRLGALTSGDAFDDIRRERAPAETGAWAAASRFRCRSLVAARCARLVLSVNGNVAFRWSQSRKVG